MKPKVYIIWIWWIWISAIARYFLYEWYEVFWSDKTNSKLIEKLIKEWCNIVVWENENRILNFLQEKKSTIFYFPSLIGRGLRGGSIKNLRKFFNKKYNNIFIYSEAVSQNHKELQKAKELDMKIFSYPEILWEITKDKKLIAISWTHWKSTTTSLTSLVLKDSKIWINAIIWTILKEFNGKNTYFSNSEYFVIEACEYKRSFLNYKPYIAVITNIDLDHLDCYKDLDDYINAFDKFIKNVREKWYVILNWNDKNCKKLIWKRKDVTYVEVYDDYFEIFTNRKSSFNEINNKSLPRPAGTPFEKGRNLRLDWDKIKFPKIKMQIPWKHILYDAHVSYIVWYILWVKDKSIINSLEDFSWTWRRMETVWITKNQNILMSDYWHHPTEISLTLEALKKKYTSKKILTIFQPHQYSRTLNLIDDFKNCFKYTDTLIVPNIYESRDSEADRKKIDSKKLVEIVNHRDKYDWEWFENTLKLIEKYEEKNKKNSIILLLWAWDVDDLRFEIINLSS